MKNGFNVCHNCHTLLLESTKDAQVWVSEIWIFHLLVIERISLGLCRAIENHTNFARLLWVVNSVVGDEPFLAFIPCRPLVIGYSLGISWRQCHVWRSCSHHEMLGSSVTSLTTRLAVLLWHGCLKLNVANFWRARRSHNDHSSTFRILSFFP